MKPLQELKGCEQGGRVVGRNEFTLRIGMAALLAIIFVTFAAAYLLRGEL